MQEGRNASRETYRGTERQTYKYTYRQTEIKTYRHTQTNRQTERQCKSIGTGWKTDRCAERPIFTHMVHTYSTVHKTDIQTDRQTDRQTGQTGQTEKNDKQTSKQADRQYSIWVLSKKIRSKFVILRKLVTRTPVSTNGTFSSIPKNGTSGWKKNFFFQIRFLGILGSTISKNGWKIRKKIPWYLVG